MGSRGDVVVSALGAVSPVGASAVQTCASLRAGISRFLEHPEYQTRAADDVGAEPEPAKVAWVPTLSRRHARDERIAKLATAALRELLGQAGLKRAQAQSAGFFFALPPPAAGAPDAGGLAVARACLRSLAVKPERPPEIVSEGHTAALTAIAQAMGHLRQGTARSCIVVASDSWIDSDHLDALDTEYRLKSDRNVDGFIPGECAVALLLETAATARAAGRTALAALQSPAFGTEPRPVTSNKLPTGQGLCQAIGEALGKAGRGALWTLCDLNGESYRSYEWGVARVRLGEALPSPEALWHPSDCLGDVGAASGALYVAMACRAFLRAYSPADRALIWTAADMGKRAACLVEPA